MTQIKAMLIRVGMNTDHATGGSMAPIFADGTFEYIPILERKFEKSEEKRTYANTVGRKGKPFSTYLPKRVWNKIVHYDPEFETYTYGDPHKPKRDTLLKLEKDDLLVFYASLTPFENSNYPRGLYIIGYFTIEKVVDFDKLTQEEIREFYQQYSNSPHFKRKDSSKNSLALIVGQKTRSKLLDQAILISETGCDSIGRVYYKVSCEIEKTLGIKGSIQRSTAIRVIDQPNYIVNLKYMLGL